MYNLQEAYLDVYYDLDDEVFDEGYQGMDHGKIQRQAKRLGGKRGDLLSNISKMLSNPGWAQASTRAARQNRTQSGPYRQAKARQARDDARADIEKYGFHEQVDLYDLIFDYLLDEGYADTEQSATVIMTNMSEDWIDDICEEVIDEANRAERELGYSPRERERARNLNQHTDRPIFYKTTKKGRGDNSDPLLNKAHKGMTANRQASHKAGRHLRGDTGGSGNVVRSRYQANKDHEDGYPSIKKRGGGTF